MALTARFLYDVVGPHLQNIILVQLLSLLLQLTLPTCHPPSDPPPSDPAPFVMFAYVVESSTKDLSSTHVTHVVICSFRVFLFANDNT